MACSFCGRMLKDDDRFCSSCGTPVQQAEQPREMPISQFWDDHGGSTSTDAPTPVQPMSAVPPAPPQKQPVQDQAQHRAAPQQYQAARQAPPPGPTYPAPERRGPSPLRWLIPLVALLVVLPFVWFVSRGDDGPSSSATTSPATSTSRSSAPSASPSSTPSSPTTSTTTGSSLRQQIADREPVSVSVSKVCSRGSGALSGTATGTSGTSCAFANAVGQAYRQAVQDESATDPVTLDGVRSPVTKRDYTLRCSGTAPVRCAGGNDASVILFNEGDTVG